MSTDASPDSIAQPGDLPCPNCGDPTPGNYCRNCGQRKSVHRASTRALLRDALEDQFSLTTELPRTLRALFTQPGFLTTEYSIGRIARYIPPLKLYLMASVMFFLALSFRAEGVAGFLGNETAPDTANAPQTAQVAKRQAQQTARLAAQRDSLQHIPDAQLSIGQRCLKYSQSRIQFCTPWNWLNRRMAPRMARLDKLSFTEVGQRIRDFLISRAPTVVFILLPLFALLLKILFWSTRRYYAEHFVFSLHVHSLLFIILTIIVLPVHWLAVWFGTPQHPLGDFEWVSLALVLWVAIYALIAMKCVYKQGWAVTTAKYAAFATAYFFVLVFALLAEVVAAMLFI